MSSIISIRGPMNTRKSSMGLSWRAAELDDSGKKTFVFDLELGVERALSHFNRERVIVWQSQPPSAEDIKQMILSDRRGVIVGKTKLWEELLTEYIHRLNDPEIAVIVFDTAKFLWSMDTDSMLQTKQEADVANKRPPRDSMLPIEYRGPNAYMDNIFFMAKNFHKDLVLLNHTREKYEKRVVDGKVQDVPIGEFELDGWKSTLDRADWGIETKRVKESNLVVAYIEKAPGDDSVVGMPVIPPTYEQLQVITQGKNISW